MKGLSCKQLTHIIHFQLSVLDEKIEQLERENQSLREHIESLHEYFGLNKDFKITKIGELK